MHSTSLALAPNKLGSHQARPYLLYVGWTCRSDTLGMHSVSSFFTFYINIFDPQKLSLKYNSWPGTVLFIYFSINDIFKVFIDSLGLHVNLAIIIGHFISMKKIFFIYEVNWLLSFGCDYYPPCFNSYKTVYVCTEVITSIAAGFKSVINWLRINHQ